MKKWEVHRKYEPFDPLMQREGYYRNHISYFHTKWGARLDMFLNKDGKPFLLRGNGGPPKTPLKSGAE